MIVPGDAGPVVLVDDLGALVLDEDADRHLRRSRRLRAGDAVALTDGQGRWQRALLTADGVEPVGDVETVPGPARSTTVAFAPTKGDRPAWAVQKLVELGVERVLIVRSDRSVVRWEAGGGALERLRRVAREALQQSRRVHLPDVEGPVAVDVALDLGCVPADASGRTGPGPEVTGVLVGPEGGWSDDERDEFARRGLVPVRLSDGVLRTETASVTAAVVLGLGAGSMHHAQREHG